MDKKKVELIFSTFQKSNPTPKIELNYVNRFTLLIAVILSARTTDTSVNKVTEQLFRTTNSPRRILDLGEKELKNHICHIGLHNSKAKNIVKLSTILIKKYNGNVPTEFSQLVALPGVGRKSANVFLNSALGIPTLAVDTHVFRVSNRIGLVKEKSIIETEKSLLATVPKKWLPHAHNWLVLHGRYVCKARMPLCKTCIIKDLCEYKRENTNAQTNLLPFKNKT